MARPEAKRSATAGTSRRSIDYRALVGVCRMLQLIAFESALASCVPTSEPSGSKEPTAHGIARAPFDAERRGAPTRTTPAPATPHGAPRTPLRIGTSNDYAPFSLNGRGFDIEVAGRLASELGYGIEWVDFDWPNLASSIAHGDIDVAMSGVTWRPDRDVAGYMTHALAVGGPCTLSRPDLASARVAVNRGGTLERWAREHFRESDAIVLAENQALPQLLARGEVGTIVTDRFELAHFMAPGWLQHCEPARDRKVYWVAPRYAATLGPQLDAWLARHELELAELRARWFGFPQSWTATDRIIDLLARRLAFMPAVAAAKRRRGLPIEVPEREQRVLENSIAAGKRWGLEANAVRKLFLLQIELAKRVQRRTPPETAPSLDLETEIRPALLRLGDRLLEALATGVNPLPALDLERLNLLEPYLTPGERTSLWSALRGVRAAQSNEQATPANAP